MTAGEWAGRLRGSLWAAWLLSLVGLGVIWAPSASAGSISTCLQVDQTLPLPQRFGSAVDVAWEDAEHILLAAPLEGVFQVPVDDPGKASIKLTGGRQSEAVDIWLPRLVASDGKFRVVASPVFVVAWQTVGEEGLRGQVAVDGPMAIDLKDGQLAVLGFSRDEVGRAAPDGAIAWLGSIKNDFKDPEPLLYSEDGPGVERMGRCAVLGAGQIAFTGAGNLIVVPGVEPGAFLVASDGKLLRTWQSADLGMDSDCQVSEDEHAQMRIGEAARWSWWNRHRVVDEVVPLPEGPAFIVRFRHRDSTYWEFVRTVGEEITRCRLPFRSSSDRTRLAADLRGRRLVLLVSTPGVPEERAPQSEAKLIWATVPSLAGTSAVP